MYGAESAEPSEGGGGETRGGSSSPVGTIANLELSSNCKVDTREQDVPGRTTECFEGQIP